MKNVLRFLRTVLNSKELKIQMKNFQLNTKIIFIGSKQVFYLLKLKNLKTEQVDLKIGLLSVQSVHQSEISSVLLLSFNIEKGQYKTPTKDFLRTK
jgi:hypothetical protein